MKKMIIPLSLLLLLAIFVSAQEETEDQNLSP